MEETRPTRRGVSGGTLPMPAVGLGCWMGYPGKEGDDEVSAMVRAALEMGYRHIDTASNYGNETQVGEAIRASGVPRADLFVTTKLRSEDHGRVRDALDESLARLGLDYVDLFLVHWPQALRPDGSAVQPDESLTIVETWRAMEDLLDTGKVRQIGVSNFSVKTLAELLAHAAVAPAVNQVEMHPLLPQNELRAFCDARGVALTAYTPLAKYRPELMAHPAVLGAARAHGCSPAQVVLGWLRARGVAVIPKTRDPARMEENLKLINLSSEEIREIEEIHHAPGMHRSACGFHSPGKMAFGWTYEQLGWPMGENGVIW